MTDERIPHKPGTVLGVVPAGRQGDKHLSPMERQVLEAGGWRPGMPIPDLTGTKIGQRLAAEVRQVAEQAADLQGLTPMPPDTPPFVPPEPVPVEQLPPEKQEAIYRTMDEMAELRNRIEAASKPPTVDDLPGQMPANLANVPGMPQAWSAAQAAKATGVQVVNDLPEGVTDPRAVPQPTLKAEDNTQPLKITPESATGVPPIGEEIPKVVGESPEKVEPTLALPCARCGHVPGAPLVKYTNEEKLAYIQTMLGGVPFSKTYTAMDGRVAVRFRTLTATARDLIAEQLAVEQSTKELVTPSQYARRDLQYQCVAAIARIVIEGRPPEELPPLEDQSFDQVKDATALPNLLAYCNARIFVTDQLRGLVGGLWGRFDQLVQVLASHADQENF